MLLAGTGLELPEAGREDECPGVLGTTFCTSLGTRYTLTLWAILVGDTAEAGALVGADHRCLWHSLLMGWCVKKDGDWKEVIGGR